MLLAVMLLVASPVLGQDVIKVLAIGNSFSEDAVEQNLHEIAAADGVTMIIGNLYIGGCSIDRHVQNIQRDAPAYAYRKVGADGKKANTNGYPLSKAITDEQWDYVSVQQVSGLSGQLQSYGNLSTLVEWVRANAPQARVIFHQTWAYAPDAKHADFKRYDCSQMQMTGAIRYATTTAAHSVNIDTIVPSLKAIYYARTTATEDNITRDGFHLNKRYARYIAAATWYATLTGVPVTGNTYRPDDMSESELAEAQRAADWAVFGPQLGGRTPQVLRPQVRRGAYRRHANYGKSIAVLGGTHAADTLSVVAKQLWANMLHSKVTTYAYPDGGLAMGQGYDMQRQADEAGVSDIYVLWLSQEDFAWCQPLGGVGSYTVADGYDSLSRTSQCGGLNYCVKVLREKSPQAKIYLFTPFDDSKGDSGTIVGTKRNAAGNTLSESMAALKKCCEKQGVEVLSQVVFDVDKMAASSSYYLPDGVRLNKAAYDKIAPVQAAFLAR